MPDAILENCGALEASWDRALEASWDRDSIFKELFGNEGEINSHVPPNLFVLQLRRTSHFTSQSNSK